MLFSYDRAANADNWLHDWIMVVMNGQLARIDAGLQPQGWKVLVVAHKAKLSSRRSLRTRLEAFFEKYSALNQAERLVVRSAVVDENRLSELFDNRLDCVRRDDLPLSIRDETEGLFSKLFDLLTDLGLRDQQYRYIYNTLEARVCAFCGCEYLEPPPFPRHDLDHYLARTIYPFAASNLHNLAPMGDRCNSSYKKQADMLRTGIGGRRKCSDPFHGPTATVSLLGSVPFGRDGGRLPLWQIDLIADCEEIRTWDDVFQIKARYAGAVLDQEYQGWLDQFGRWAAQHVPGTDVRLLLDSYIALLRPEGVVDRAFLRLAVFEMLRDRCDDQALGQDVVAQLTDVINLQA